MFLDAIQGLGIYPLTQKTPVDFLAADGHKWLLGPEGAGVAMIAKRHLNKLRCLNVGWGSVKNSFNYADPSLVLKDAASRFEAGSANMIGAAALSASLKLILDVIDRFGEDAISERICNLAASLDEQLLAAGAITRTPQPTRQKWYRDVCSSGLEPAKIEKKLCDKK